MSSSYAAIISPKPSILAENSFRFLNVQRECSSRSAWTSLAVEKLWRYNLHYFDDLNALGARERLHWHRRLLDRWVLENPVGEGDGWEPYPISRRIVNWVKWSLTGNTLSPACRESLAVQTRWLMNRLEYHILGNHLLANAKALIHSGLFFDGVEAQRWLSRGMDILQAQISEQLLTDGGHFELSPMYHAIVLEDLLDTLNLLRAFERPVPNEWLTRIADMQRWLGSMIHPDGDFAFFNDTALEIAPTWQELHLYSARLYLPTSKSHDGVLTALENSGYVAARLGRTYLICDCARVGPDYLPGHAHADTLSFELSIGAQRVFVNSGTSIYGADAERQRQRGTKAHNTIVVSNSDSSEVWGGFRVARRAQVRLNVATFNPQAGTVEIDASHDGYRRLSNEVEHRRCWKLSSSALFVEDRLIGQVQAAQARFHLHPAINAHSVSDTEVELTWENGVVLRVSFDSDANVKIEPSTWHPTFGVSVANRCLVVALTKSALLTQIEWLA